ncbi:MAG TPA: SdpI family protein [archaeon]|nr:SdpI family protein [archaeon]
MKRKIIKEIPTKKDSQNNKLTKILYTTIIGLILVLFVASFYFAPMIPETVAVHWNASGVADGYAGKDFGLYFLPILTIIIAVILVFIPKLDPLKKNILESWNKYLTMVIFFIGFMGYLHFLTIYWNLGNQFNFSTFIAPAFGVLFFYIGWFIKDVKQNYFVGIRTPWTLNNKEVWEKTHKFGGKLFQLSGIIAILGMFFENISIFLIIAPVILSAIIITIYSYIEFRKIKK